MALLAPFGHPLVIHPIVGWGTKPSGHPRVPPSHAFAGRASPRSGRSDATHGIARSLTHALLTDALDRERAVAEVTEAVVDDVVVWSPGLFVTSRDELIAQMLESDDSLADVSVTIVSVTIAREASDGEDTAVLEWQLRGRFRRAGLLNDDVLVEPSGAMVESSGVVAMGFSGDRVRSIRCYYDLLGLFEQLLV